MKKKRMSKIDLMIQANDTCMAFINRGRFALHFLLHCWDPKEELEPCTKPPQVCDSTDRCTLDER